MAFCVSAEAFRRFPLAKPAKSSAPGSPKAAPAQACRPLIFAAPEHTQRRHALQTPMSFAAASSVISPRSRPALAVAEHGDVVVLAEAAHALLRPGIGVPGLDAAVRLSRRAICRSGIEAAPAHVPSVIVKSSGMRGSGAGQWSHSGAARQHVARYGRRLASAGPRG